MFNQQLNFLYIILNRSRRTTNINDKPIEPIKFRNAIEIDGETYLEVTDQEIPNIKPDTYFINMNGKMYTKNRNKEKLSTVNKRGYVKNQARLTTGGKASFSVHRLVEQVFDYYPGCTKLEVNHKDGNKQNNNVYNLEWVTGLENVHHAYETGLNQNYGANNSMVYLTDEQLHQIMERLKAGNYDTYGSLAAEFGCNEQIILRLATGRTGVRLAEEVGYTPKKKNKRFSKEDVHEMCKIFEQNKGRHFSVIYKKVLAKLDLEDDHNTHTKISRIYNKFPHYFTSITDQYDYL